jgi:large subunit ribosomal protein L31
MAEGDIVMKANIHPKYGKITVTCSTCGNTFESGSTAKEIRVDTCANCHPFFTGKQKFAAADGRIDKFNKRYGIDTK